jgi:hypothetical protein
MTGTNNKTKDMRPHASNIGRKAFERVVHFSLIKVIENQI